MDKLPINKPSLKAARQELRNNPTSAELLLWQSLRGSQAGAKIRRQRSIGNYIVDFYCPAVKLIIEIDGGYHQEIKQQIIDSHRDKTLKQEGFHILRFPNDQAIHQTTMVFEFIQAKIKELLR